MYVLLYTAVDWQVVFQTIQEQERLKEEELRSLTANLE